MWRASHSLIHTNVVNKQSLPSAVSIFNAFSLHTVSFRIPFSLHTVGFRIPSALSFLRPVVSLTFYLAISHLEQWLTAHYIPSLYYLWPISCPYQYILLIASGNEVLRHKTVIWLVLIWFYYALDMCSNLQSRKFKAAPMRCQCAGGLMKMTRINQYDSASDSLPKGNYDRFNGHDESLTWTKNTKGATSYD